MLLGNGLVTPWPSGGAPDDAWDALDDIEAVYSDDLDILMKSVRRKLDLGGRRG